MPYVNLGAYKFYYTEYGDKNNQPVVLLHAFTLDSRMWEADARELSKQYYVIAIDAKGHGKSDAPESGYTRDERVTDLEQVLNLLELPKVHLVGLSYGGTTALGFALKLPERLYSLTLIGTSAGGYKLGTKMSKIDEIAKNQGVEVAKERWIKSSLLWYTNEQEHIRKLVETMMLEHSGAVWKDPVRGYYPQLNDIEIVNSITTPTKIMVGDSDKIFLPLSKILHKSILNSELTIIPDCGHLVNLEKPEVFQQELLEFLNKSR